MHERSALFDDALDGRHSARCRGGRGGVDRDSNLAQTSAVPRRAGFLRTGERRHRLRDGGCGRHQSRAPRSTDRRSGRRWQRDGSAMYSIQALWTAAHFKLPITYVIPNNRGYRILKERLKSLRGTDKFIGMDFVEPEIDFVLRAQSMGVPAQRITDPAEIGPAMQAALARSGPSLLDIPVANGFGQ